MQNRSFMFLCFLQKNHWELKCQHSSQQVANNETQSSGNEGPLNVFGAFDRSAL